MTDQEVIETLAKRDGWKITGTFECDGKTISKWVQDGRAWIFSEPPCYLRSIDALRPVLPKLSEDEWFKLMGILWAMEPPKPGISVGRFLLTISPETLARAIAEVIKE